MFLSYNFHLATQHIAHSRHTYTHQSDTHPGLQALAVITIASLIYVCMENTIDTIKITIRTRLTSSQCGWKMILAEVIKFCHQHRTMKDNLRALQIHSSNWIIKTSISNLTIFHIQTHHYGRVGVLY